MRSRRAIAVAITLLTGGLAAGCSKDKTTQGAGPSVEQQIKEIQANPNMPPQAKTMAIQQLRARQGGQGTLGGQGTPAPGGLGAPGAASAPDKGG